MASSHTYVGSISTRASDGTTAGLLLSGTSVTHDPATGGSASGYSLNLATGAHVSKTASLDPASASGGALTVSNSTTQTSGNLVLVTGTTGQTAVNVAAGDTVLQGTTIADGANDLDVASHDGSNGLKLGGTLVTSSAAELNLLDGAAGNTVVNDKAVVYGSSGEVAGTLSTAAQPNVTSVGNLSGLTIAQGANDLNVASHDGASNGLQLGGTLVTSSAAELNLLDGAAGNTVVNDKAVVYGSSGEVAGTLSTAAQPNVTSLGTQAADLDMGSSFKVVNLAAPATDSDAANKAYVDARVEGVDLKQEVRVASTDNVDISTLNDGDVMDGVTLATNDRVLLKDQATARENGVYVVAATEGATARAADMDTGAAASGAGVNVMFGTVNALRGYVCTNASGSDIVGTDHLTFVLFHEGPISAGAGLSKSGVVLNIDIASEANLGAAPDGTDELLISDAGVIKAVTVANLNDAAFASVSGDATIASGGALTIAAGAVENSMLAGSIEVSKTQLAAGSGLALSTNTLSVDIASEANLGAAPDGTDELLISDAGVIKAVTVANLNDAAFASVSGDATIASGGALTIAAGAVENSMLAGSIEVSKTQLAAGSGLALSTNTLNIDIASEANLGAAPDGTDELLISDAGVIKAVTVANLNDAAFASVSGDATIASGGALTIAAGAVENSMLAGSIEVSKTQLAAGSGLALSTNTLNIDIASETNLGAAPDGTDELLISDAGVIKAVTVANLNDAAFASVSGDATIASGGALTIAAGAVENSMLAGSIEVSKTQLAAGSGLALSTNTLNIDIASEANLGAAPDGTDELLISDAGVIKAVTVANLNDAAFASVSGDATIASGGALTIAAGAVENSMLAGSIEVSKTQLAAGSGLALSTNTLSVDIAGATNLGAAPDVADELLISDAGVIKAVTVANLGAAAFALVNGDATISSVGALTIAAGAVENSMLAGSIEVSKTQLAAGTGLTLSTNTLSVDAAQTQITSVGQLQGLTIADGANDLNIASHDGVNGLQLGGTLVTSSAAELNLLDGAASNTVVNDKAVVYGSSGEVAGTLSTAAQPNVTSVGTLSSLAVGGDVVVHEATNDANPVLALGAAAAERAELQAVYDTSAQTLDKLVLRTKAASAAADKGKIEIEVDEALVATFADGALNLASGKALEINGTSVLNATTLGSGVTASSLTSVGQLQGLTIADGAYDLNVASHDGTNGLQLGGTLVTATAAELNLVDGASAGTVANSKAVVYSASGVVNATSLRTSGVQALTTSSGAVDVVNGITTIATPSGSSYGLGDGVEGQIKILTMVANAGTGVVEPDNLRGFVNIQFDAIGDSCVLCFISGSWSVIANNGATLG